MGSKAEQESGTIIFATVGRPQYAFDVFALSLPADFPRGGDEVARLKEECLTDGKSVNFNGHLVEGSAKRELLHWIKKRDGPSADNCEVLNAAVSEEGVDLVIHVTERDGCLSMFYSLSYDQAKRGSTPEALFEKLGLSSDNKHKLQRSGNVLLAKSLLGGAPEPYLQDRPQIGGGRIVFVATYQDPGSERQSWAAVYSVDFLQASSPVARLTPKGVSDLSPSISPSGKWVIVASLEGKGWQGEVQMLETDLYVFDASDGSQRKLVMKNAGWPSWADESTVYFHRVARDGWWSVFRLSLTEGFLTSGEGEIAQECRVTPPGVHAFTPSASRTGDWIAVATRRAGLANRHVEVFDLRSRTFIKLTENISPTVNHYNPFVSPSSGKIVYHHCRGHNPILGDVSIVPRLEPLLSPISGVALLRVDGTFPSISHDGSLLVFVWGQEFNELVVTKLNGEGKRRIFTGAAFGTAWDWQRKGVVYTASGQTFSSEESTVHIIAISDIDAALSTNNAEQDSSLDDPPYKILTKEGSGNNAFPSPSPDGKHIVFRSGRNGHKNLYIMDAIKGEEGGIRQLTDGPWTDTMPNWSPTGEWIAFSSNRDDPDAGHFIGYLIHPDGSGLHKILDDGGRVNHLSFSPDGQSLVFTSDFAAVSAEPIACPNQFQPYGEIFISKIDGSAKRRLTHNAYEDGTPCWGPRFIHPDDLSSKRGNPVTCGFDDTNWLVKGGESGIAQRGKTGWCPFPNS